MQTMALEETFAGYAGPEGLKITSFTGGLSVDISGADHVGFDEYLPKAKDRKERQVAILAVLADNAERRAIMHDQEVFDKSPYIVDVGVVVDPDDRWCVPASHPEDATLFIQVIRDEWMPRHEGPYTSVRLFTPSD